MKPTNRWKLWVHKDNYHPDFPWAASVRRGTSDHLNLEVGRWRTQEAAVMGGLALVKFWT